MSRQDSLTAEITKLKAETPTWPTSFSPEKKAQFDELNRQTLKQCETLLRQDFPNEIAIRAFLKSRWNEIANSSMDYTHNPNLPSNIACLSLAKIIAHKNEAVCQIMMPTITHVIGGVFDNVKDASENNDNDFVPHDFMLSEDGCALVAIPDIYAYTSERPERLFSADNALFHLTEEARHQLREIAEKNSSDYYDALEALWNYKPTTLANALNEFVMTAKYHLRAIPGSEPREKDIFDSAIKKLFQHWKLLSLEQKTRANHAYTLNGPTLEAYLRVLFMTVPHLYTEYEYATLFSETQTVDARIILSKNFIANCLSDILTRNSETLSEIQTFPIITPPTTEHFQKLQCNLEKALMTRAPMQGNLEADNRLTMHLLDVDANASPTGFGRLFQIPRKNSDDVSRTARLERHM